MVALLVLCLAFSVACGVSTAHIIKKLDNIVKLYSQAISNSLTTVASLLFFPKNFKLDGLYVVCLLLTFVAIFLYENDNIDLSGVTERASQLVFFVTRSTLRTVILICSVTLLLSLIIVFYRLQSVGDWMDAVLVDPSIKAPGAVPDLNVPSLDAAQV